MHQPGQTDLYWKKENRKTLEKLMNKSQLTLLLMAILFGQAAMAGSERWIMRTTVSEMSQTKLIHVQFRDLQGKSLESSQLKQLIVQKGECGSASRLRIIEDYRYGYYPEPKQVGIFLPAKSWDGETLCFQLKGSGEITKKFTPQDIAHPVVLQLQEN